MVKDIRKKLLKTIFLIAIIVMIIIPKQEIAASNIMLGDINGDKIVDSRDMLYILRHIATNTNKKHPEWELKEEKLKAADVTKDGKVDAEDMLLVLRYIAANNSETIKNKHPEWIEFKKKETVEKTKEQEKEEKVEDIKEQEQEKEQEKTEKQESITEKETKKQEEQTTTPEAKAIEVEKVEINKKSIELDMSETKTVILKATITPNTATDKTITWTSSNTKVATVDKKSGKVTAKKNGTAQITANSNNGKKATCKITVTTSATKVGLSKTSTTVKIGKTTQNIVAIVSPKNATDEVEWTNKNPESIAIEKEIEAGTYYIKTALDNNKVIDIKGPSTENGAKVQLYKRNEARAQQFIITKAGEGYYTIKSKNSNKMLDVKEGEKTAGTIVQQHTSNGTDAQKWEFEYAGNGYYYIKSKCNGLYLDVKGGETDNGTQLQVYTENRSKSQKFKLEVIKKKAIVVEEGTYYLKTALDNNKVVEVKGESKENDEKIQINNNKKTNGQKFELLSAGNNYYIIRAKCSNKVLDVPNASQTSGTQIQQHYLNGTEAQIWKIESAGNGYYYIKSKCNGLYLDVKGGKTANGTAIQIQTGNKSNAQKFKLENTGDTVNNNISIVTIKGKGIKDATGTVIAKTTNGKTATCKVTVQQVALDFSYKGNGKVKAEFSSETLKIVENHLYDVNAQNFYKVINSYGGFDKYAKSLGGVFGKYYGKTITGRTEYDFQMAAEYVLGWMFMYGWDYTSGVNGAFTGRHEKWGGSNYTKDAFYYGNNAWKSKYKGKFDDVISGKYGVGMMASECGDLETFIYQKLGMTNRKQPKHPTRLKDLKVGDGVYFFNHRVNKSSESNWGIGTHNVIVGEVKRKSDKICIVFYDAGSFMQGHLDYKRKVEIPKDCSEEAEYDAMFNQFKFSGWGARRWYNFKE